MCFIRSIRKWHQVKTSASKKYLCSSAAWLPFLLFFSAIKISANGNYCGQDKIWSFSMYVSLWFIYLNFLVENAWIFHWWHSIVRILKFIYSEKATKLCEIFTLFLTVCTIVKSIVKISQNCVAFSEHIMNFTNKIYFNIES